MNDLGIVEALRSKGDRCDIHNEQHDMGDIELPDALEQPRCTNDEAAIQDHSRVDEGRSISRDENEQVCGIAESEIPSRDPVHRVVGHVIEKDRPVC